MKTENHVSETESHKQIQVDQTLKPLQSEALQNVTAF